MSDPVTLQSPITTTTTQAGSAVQHARIAPPTPPEDYVPLSAEGILIFCQSRLREFDTDIQKKMTGQKHLIGLQQSIAGIASTLKGGDRAVNKDDNVAFDSPAFVKTLDDKINAAIAEAKASGSPEVVKTLLDVQTRLHTGGDNLVSKEEVKDMSGMLDSALANTRSGAELDMIDIQSLVSKRASTLQLTTNIMNSINEAIKSIGANIGRG